jgi:replicative DNA helicase
VRVTARQRSPLPPHDLEAEQAVLGAAMLDAAARTDVLERLGADDFYQPAHRTVFGAIAALEARGGPVDAVTVGHQLQAAGELAGVGGGPFLHTLVAGVPTAGHAGHYARIVRDCAERRRLIDKGTRLAQVGYEASTAAEAAEAARSILGTEILRPAGELGVDQRRLLAGGAFILDAPKDVPAVWGGGEQVAWAQGEPLLIVGPAGVGKTTLAGQLVEARIGIGGSVLGVPVAEGKRVLYLACDRPSQVQRALARLFADTDREVLDERLLVWKGPPPADLARHPEALLRLCERAEADTVVLDSLKDVALGLADDEVGAALNAALQRVIVEGIEVLGLHHQRKNSAGGGRPKKLEDVYGSTWITAGAGSVILLWGEAGDPIVELSHLKPATEPVGPLKVLHDHDHGRSEVAEQIDVLKVLLHRPGLTAADLAALLRTNGRPTDNDRERARRRLDRLVRADLAICDAGSKGGRGGGTPTRYYASARAERDASAPRKSDHGGDHAP